MKRVMIVGSGGSGKSTLPRQVGKILNIEVFHFDAIHWKPGWIETPLDEWKVIIDKLTKKEAWIIDGNYGDSTMETRFQAAALQPLLHIYHTFHNKLLPNISY